MSLSKVVIDVVVDKGIDGVKDVIDKYSKKVVEDLSLEDFSIDEEEMEIKHEE